MNDVIYYKVGFGSGKFIVLCGFWLFFVVELWFGVWFNVWEKLENLEKFLEWGSKFIIINLLVCIFGGILDFWIFCGFVVWFVVLVFNVL